MTKLDWKEASIERDAKVTLGKLELTVEYREIEKNWHAYISLICSKIKPTKKEAQDAIERILIQLRDKLIEVLPPEKAVVNDK